MSVIAFFGLGHMGGPMARRLLRDGHAVIGFDPSATAREAFAAAGGRCAPGPEDAAADAQMVISMLPAAAHVEALYLGGAGEPGLLSLLDAETLVMDCSTTGPAAARRVALAAECLGLDWLDVPVSGGTAGAEAGTLTFMAGGTATALQRARPVLRAMGNNVFHAGEAGAGQTAKLCNNMLLGVLMAATAEALQLGVAHGLDPRVLSEIISRSSGRNWALETYNPWPGVMPGAPASREYRGGFASALMLKDLGLATEAALQSGSATPLGELARNLYALHNAGGRGEQDFSSILELLRGGPPGPASAATAATAAS
ncbi:3-hydroxyisobutyrate dehydrogenase [Aquabacterium sp. A7-Y]|uniref:3-hydroxyisobutyrate dehydrogenase n=1 Tax=Aquabacterium sp. A7-Y TaxID=1349605 RepID=UPI00223E272C|nr:3-hydroxyisobutyrate dehydrogenase [Aquabacterium sp. A7-Y]MCW7539766.1 3-hydroxyisobutyrate dehydrogenase [Aquabacterium sp. A7-Y]